MALNNRQQCENMKLACWLSTFTILWVAFRGGDIIIPGFLNKRIIMLSQGEVHLCASVQGKEGLLPTATIHMKPVTLQL